MNTNTINATAPLTFNLDRHAAGVGQVQWLHSCTFTKLAYVRDLQTNATYPATIKSLKKIK